MAATAAAEPVAAAHDGHAGHHEATPAGHRDCDHCPPGGAQAAALCKAGLSADCGAPADVSADSRKSEFNWKGGYTAIAPPVFAARPPDARRSVPTPPDDPGLLRRSTGPSLSIRYCVFLK